jgi:hypothetical protein
VENVGLLPTASALARRRDARGDVALTLEGVTLVAVDRRDSQGGSTTSTSFELRSPLTLGTLAPGESCALRLFLEAAEGAEVRLRVAAPRAGTAALQLVLR